jgi:5-methylcytosine-specific restriction endonuclease McrA
MVSCPRMSSKTRTKIKNKYDIRKIETAFKKVSRDRAWSEQNRRCYYCRGTLTREEATIEHLVPRCANGGDSPDNVKVACTTCNYAKASMSEVKFWKILKSPNPPEGVNLIKAWMAYRIERRLQKALERISQFVGLDG